MGNEILIEDLDPVEARRRNRSELFRQIARDRDLAMDVFMSSPSL